MTGPTEINQISGEIGKLKAVTERLQVHQDHMLSELRDIGVRLVPVAEVITELREYRKTLHERFGRIHEQLASVDRQYEQANILSRTQHAELLAMVDRRYVSLSETAKYTATAVDKRFVESNNTIDKRLVGVVDDLTLLAKRVVKLEEFVLIFKTNWRIAVIAATAVASIVGWILSEFGHSVVHKVFGG